VDSWVVMFTGQGAQRVGMGSDVDEAAKSKAVWDCACDISGFDVRRMCWKGPMGKLSETRYQQVAVTAVNLASYYALKASRLLPEDSVFIGHSVGEYSALHASGALDLEQTFKAVNARAIGMQTQAEQTKGAMYAVKGGSIVQVNDVIDAMGLHGQVVIANDNSPLQVVIAGNSGIVKQVGAELSGRRLPTVRLAVNGAWHSPLMAGMLPEYGSLLRSLDIRMPSSQILMNRSAQEPLSPQEIRDNLTYHVVETVRWRETVEKLLQRNKARFLEVGPRKVLCALVPDCGSLGSQAQTTHCSQMLRSLPSHLPAPRLQEAPAC